MSVLVVGLSHRTAPVSVLERAAVPVDDVRKTVEELHRAEMISEVMLLSTCNRIEVYADVARFHPAVAEITTVLARHSGLAVSDLSDHLYVHFAEAAAEHIFTVASGLDSMVVGESQILGQLRNAYALGTETGSVGSVLHDLGQTALRVGKRVHSETGIDKAGASIVSVALDRAESVLGSLEHRTAVVIGAGSMGALAGATLRRRGIGSIVVANRSMERGARLAERLGGTAIPLTGLADAIADADLLVSSTGSTGLIVEADAIGSRAERPLVVLDIALPRDVDPAVAALPGVRLIALDTLGRELREVPAAAGIDDVRTIVAEELAAFLTARRSQSVTPTVVALRSMATGVVQAELARLDSRLPHLDEAARAEVERAINRVADKLLHQPTVRVKELANESGAISYAAALAELFSLDPEAVEAVTRAEVERP
jgi:glutamyl-tRNA reductase